MKTTITKMRVFVTPNITMMATNVVIPSRCLLAQSQHLLKVNYGSPITICEMYSKVVRTNHNDVIAVVPVFLLLTLNIFHTLFWCFYCQL